MIKSSKVKISKVKTLMFKSSKFKSLKIHTSKIKSSSSRVQSSRVQMCLTLSGRRSKVDRGSALASDVIVTFLPRRHDEARSRPVPGQPPQATPSRPQFPSLGPHAPPLRRTVKIGGAGYTARKQNLENLL